MKSLSTASSTKQSIWWVRRQAAFLLSRAELTEASPSRHETLKAPGKLPMRGLRGVLNLALSHCTSIDTLCKSLDAGNSSQKVHHFGAWSSPLPNCVCSPTSLGPARAASQGKSSCAVEVIANGRAATASIIAPSVPQKLSGRDEDTFRTASSAPSRVCRAPSPNFASI